MGKRSIITISNMVPLELDLDGATVCPSGILFVPSKKRGNVRKQRFFIPNARIDQVIFGNDVELAVVNGT